MSEKQNACTPFGGSTGSAKLTRMQLSNEFVMGLAKASESVLTDADLLDWLDRTKTGIGYNVEACAWGVDYEPPSGPTIREAIRGAIAPSQNAQGSGTPEDGR